MDSLDYQMIRWNSGFFYKHPRLQDIDFYWRVEPEVGCPILTRRPDGVADAGFRLSSPATAIMTFSDPCETMN